MLYAINELGEKIRPTVKVKATCPCCGMPVRKAMGDIIIHHWKHEAETNCNAKQMTQWHIEWQSHFPKENVEIYVNKQRRADVLTNDKMCVEFQHSTISIFEIEKRNFLCDGNIIWIHDYQKQYENKQFVNIKQDAKRVNLYRGEWINASKIFNRHRGQDKGIYFQFTEDKLGKLCWIDYGDESKKTTFSFWMINKLDFINWIIEKCK